MKLLLIATLAISTFAATVRSQTPVQIDTLARNAELSLKLQQFDRMNRGHDPYASDASFTARISESIRLTSPSFVWDHEILIDRDKNEFQKLSASYAAKLDPNRFSIMEDAFKRRKQKHLDNLELVIEFKKYEMQINGTKAGLDQATIQRLFGQPSSAVVDLDQFTDALRNFQIAESNAENQLAVTLCEILTPAEMEGFIVHFSRNNLHLAHPLFVEYLMLSPQQVRRIQTHINTSRRLECKLRAEEIVVAEREGKSRPSPPNFLKNDKFWAAYYAPYAELTPSQFEKVAHHSNIKKRGETFAQFRDRMSGMKSLVLGKLVEQGVAEETK